jgi:hypothetical protein
MLFDLKQIINHLNGRFREDVVINVELKSILDEHKVSLQDLKDHVLEI